MTLGRLVTVPHTAVMKLVPPATPVTRPELLTVATDIVPLVQLEGVQALEDASEYVAVAVSCCVPPTAMLPASGESTTRMVVGPVGEGELAPLIEKGIGTLVTPLIVAVSVPYPVPFGRILFPCETPSSALLGVNVADGPQSVVSPFEKRQFSASGIGV